MIANKAKQKTKGTHMKAWAKVTRNKETLKDILNVQMISTTDSQFHPSILIVLGRLTCRTKPHISGNQVHIIS